MGAIEDDAREADGRLYAGLQELAAGAFPKRCPACGDFYPNVEDYLRRTGRVASGVSGLKQSVDDDGNVIVELFRNCQCGSTLLDFFSDRRDRSKAGLERRARFAELVDQLVARGFARTVARAELLRVLRGEPSAVLGHAPRRPEVQG